MDNAEKSGKGFGPSLIVLERGLRRERLTFD
jgi:hypothetical protein